jgi:hypothetical protein
MAGFADLLRNATFLISSIQKALLRIPRYLPSRLRCERLAVFDLLRRRWHGGDVILCAFDLIELDGQGLRGHQSRSANGPWRTCCAGSATALIFNEHYTGDGAIIYKHACALGCEGIVSKRLGLPPFRSTARAATNPIGWRMPTPRVSPTKATLNASLAGLRFRDGKDVPSLNISRSMIWQAWPREPLSRNMPRRSDDGDGAEHRAGLGVSAGLDTGHSCRGSRTCPYSFPSRISTN